MKINKNTIFVAIIVIIIIVGAILVSGNSAGGFSFSNIFGSSIQPVGEKVVKYINDNNLASSPAELVSVSEESGMVKVTLKIGEQEYESYATKDGKILWPTKGLELEPQDNSGATNQDGAGQIESPDGISKSDAPLLEAFVVSRCPYGMQMQRMIADAVSEIPSLAQYVKVKYIGATSGDAITSMHGDAEATENLRQICLREEQPSKYSGYVSCQLKAGDTSGCEGVAGVDSSALNACVSDASRGVAYAQKDFTASDGYGITSSPTLAINGSVVAEFDSSKQPIFGGRVSDEIKTIVCDAFNSQPSFCSTQLKTTSAATGFSETYGASTAANSDNVTCQ